MKIMAHYTNIHETLLNLIDVGTAKIYIELLL